jgi:predicted SnoaL-like aldol condensation-catalyzing enzyme
LGRPAEAVQSFAIDRYVDINPKFVGGKDAFIEFFDQPAREHPHKHVDFRNVIGEGNFVVLHCFYRWGSGPDSDGIDIFRMDDHGRIAQHWGFIDGIPEPSAHANAMS